MSHESPSQELPNQEAPSHELPKAYDPSAIEQRWAEYWVRERLFDVPTPASPPIPTQAPGEKFTILLPPPNVTGRLHMGHMLNQTEMDILTRWHRMRGQTALWVPGTDHAGIATQMMVERQLAAEGTSRHDLGRHAFVEKVWAWRELYGSAILDQMKRLGASVDWTREYFTMDEKLSPAVKEAFVRLYEQGLIYRGAYIVNWDPVAQTAVSDLEVEHEERTGKLFFLRYPLTDGSGHITIATTRPETMLGDVAVVVNPSDERYLALQNKTVRLPLSGINGLPDREIPILADDWAKPEFGTGAVKVTPAHDPNDFAIGKRHNLAQPNIFDPTAHVDLPGSPYHGLDRFVARERILADLEALGLLAEVKDHTLAIGLSQRTGAIIEPRLSLQWFLAVNKEPYNGGNSIAQNAIRAIDEGHIRFTPDQYRKTYDEWMKNIHDWCISRQLWWGHRIPAWHCAACTKITVARDTPTRCQHCDSTDITQETDVLDTWFSSGLLPFTVFGWPTPHPDTGAPPLTADLAAFYPTQLLVTGFDILFFWVARMIMLSCHFMLDVPMPDGSPRTLADAVPFREVYIHGLVRDANREKMSKTKGNVINPIDIIERFGTDAVRFTLASMASPGTDIAFSEARTEGNRAFANKIWNAARFIFMNLARAKGAGVNVDLTTLSNALKTGDDNFLESRWIRARLSKTSDLVNTALSEYRFDEAANHLYQFFWGDFCDWYLELVKLRLDFVNKTDLPARTAALVNLLAVFEASLRLLSPFMPFLTEEIWHAFYEGQVPHKSIALTSYPVAEDARATEKDLADMEILQQIIVAVRSLRKDLAVPEKEIVPIHIHLADPYKWLLEREFEAIAKLARVGSIELADQAVSGANTRSTPDFDVAVIYERQIDVPAERERLTRELARLEKILTTSEQRLSDEVFLAKAPPHIIEGLKKQAADTRTLYEKTQTALASLKAI
ncbi:MAG: valine--tRNA ligase [Acidobacteriota bacterium]|nr:valine--tRNA ligase [Acidobacteriota bacterium]